jgi:hypothetical protein
MSALFYNEDAWNNPENGRLAGTIIERKLTQRIRTQRVLMGGLWDDQIQHVHLYPQRFNEILTIEIRILWSKQSETTSLTIWEDYCHGLGQWNGKMGMNGSLNESTEDK